MGASARRISAYLKTMRALFAATMVVVLAAFTPLPAAALDFDPAVLDAALQEGNTAVYTKSEVVYATLSPEGSLVNAYVVNRFDVSQAGSIVDFGDYEYGKDLSSNRLFGREDDATVVKVDEGVFSYQGNTSRLKLPWNVSIGYELDGCAVDASALAGASGHLRIHGTTTKNRLVNPTFFDSFVLQVTFTLDGAKCKGIVAEGATIATAGSDQTVAFTVLPGRDGDFAVEADVEDFEMQGAQITALPYTSPIDIPETEGLTDGLHELADGVAQLSSGAGSLASGAARLADGADALASGTAPLKEGIDSLSASGSQIAEGSATVAGAISAQSDAVSEISQSLSAYAAAAGDPQLEQLAGALGKVSQGMTELDAQYAQMDQGLARYTGGAEQLAGGFDQFEQGVASLATGARELASGASRLEGGAAEMRRETADMPSVMQAEIDKMTSEFDFPEFVPTSFMSELNTSVEAVQFVLTTEPIEKPAEEAPAAEEDAEQTFWDRLLALFGL